MTLVLADLEPPLEPVKLLDGTEHPVQPINAVTRQMVTRVHKRWHDALAAEDQNLEAEEAEWLAGLRKAALRCIPTATEEQIKPLTETQLDCILAISSRQEDMVQKYMDQIRGKATTTGEASTSETPSATPSPESPKPSAGGRRKSGAVPIG